MAEQVSGAGKQGKIYEFESLPSTFDKAFELIGENRLEIWDAVLAKSQTQGIGQLRRTWQSPADNLYVSFRLPVASPFNSMGASVIVGFLCAHALRILGWPVVVKWPNDLILIENGKPAKVGGILLEEKAGALVAGIGINIISAPLHLRDDAAMQATFLFSLGGLESLKNPLNLWNAILADILDEYKKNPALECWRDNIEDLLLWRGQEVNAEAGADKITGRLLGIASSGAALIQTGNDIMEVDNGSLSLAGHASI